MARRQFSREFKLEAAGRSRSLRLILDRHFWVRASSSRSSRKLTGCGVRSQSSSPSATSKKAAVGSTGPRNAGSFAVFQRIYDGAHRSTRFVV